MSARDSFRGFLHWVAGPSEESESERAYSRRLNLRAKLNDDEFYATFYAGTGIQRDIPVRLRKLYERIIGDDLSALHPEDNQALIYDGLDFALVLYRVEREFKVTIPLTVLKSETAKPAEIDGTFDSVVRYLDKVKRDEQRS